MTGIPSGAERFYVLKDLVAFTSSETVHWWNMGKNGLPPAQSVRLPAKESRPLVEFIMELGQHLL